MSGECSALHPSHFSKIRICGHFQSLSDTQVQREHYEDALVLLGKSNPFGPESSTSRSSSGDGGIKLHSSICHLRGILHLRLSSVLDAKESFMEALMLDVKNYDAFRELIDGKMMTSEEGR